MFYSFFIERYAFANNLAITNTVPNQGVDSGGVGVEVDVGSFGRHLKLCAITSKYFLSAFIYIFDGDAPHVSLYPVVSSTMWTTFSFHFTSVPAPQIYPDPSWMITIASLPLIIVGYSLIL